MKLYTTQSQVEDEILTIVKDSGVFEKHSFFALSKVYTLIRALARAVYMFVDTALIGLEKAMHPQTAEEEDLYLWLERYGLTRKEATYARHYVRIGTKAQPLYDLKIPQGYVVSTNSGVKFQTIAATPLPATTEVDEKGFYTVEVLVECLTAGTVGNVIRESIINVDDVIDQMEVSYNPYEFPFVVARDLESVTEIRSRLFQEENTTNVWWTPEWFKNEAEKYDYVERAIFKSSKSIGIHGTVKLLCVGQGKLPLTNEQILEMETAFNGVDMNPGGTARVVVENVNVVEVNKTFTVLFASEDSIPDLATFQNVRDSYFLTLFDNQDFLDAGMKASLLRLPGSVTVNIDPEGDETVGVNELAVPGSGFVIEGVVYE